MRPNLPTVGDTLTIFGLSGTVAYVEPEDDFHWSVEVEVSNGAGHVEGLRIIVPTDYHTITNRLVWV